MKQWHRLGIKVTVVSLVVLGWGRRGGGARGREKTCPLLIHLGWTLPRWRGERPVPGEGWPPVFGSVLGAQLGVAGARPPTAVRGGVVWVVQMKWARLGKFRGGLNSAQSPWALNLNPGSSTSFNLNFLFNPGRAEETFFYARPKIISSARWPSTHRRPKVFKRHSPITFHATRG